MNIKTIKLIRDVANCCHKSIAADMEPLRDCKRYIYRQIELAYQGYYGEADAAAMHRAFAKAFNAYCKARFLKCVGELITEMNQLADDHRARLNLPPAFRAFIANAEREVFRV